MKILLLVYAVGMGIYGLYMYIPVFMDAEARKQLGEKVNKIIDLEMNPICAYIFIGLTFILAFMLTSFAWPYSLIIDIKNHFRMKKLDKFYKDVNKKAGAQ